MLTGEKKKTYQRNYMRKRRALLKLSKLNSGVVRPKTLTPIRPLIDVAGYRLYDRSTRNMGYYPTCNLSTMFILAV